MCVVLKFIRGKLNVCGPEVHKGASNVCGPEVHKGASKCVWS